MLWKTEFRFPADVGVGPCRSSLVGPPGPAWRHQCDGGMARAAPWQVKVGPERWQSPRLAPAWAAEWEAGHASTRPGSGNPCPYGGTSRTARFRCIWPFATCTRRRHGSLWPCVVAAGVVIRLRLLAGMPRLSTGMRSRPLPQPAVALPAWDPRRWHQRHQTHRRPRRQGLTIASTGRTRAGPFCTLCLLCTGRRVLSFRNATAEIVGIEGGTQNFRICCCG
jgi:hypothetical protein